MNSPAFPLKLSANRRYLVDTADRPFLYHADTAWRLPICLTLPEAEHYLEDRKRKGFNALHFHAVNKEQEGPINRNGDAPFVDDDLSRPNEPYWKHLDAVLDAATRRGFFLAISCAWLGYGGSGYRPFLTNENARAYGNFLGRRYARLQNVLWILGGDNDPDEKSGKGGEKLTATRELARGLRETAPHHLRTYHAGPEHASAFWFAGDDWLDVNFAYTYKPAHEQVASEYTRKSGPPRPLLLAETGYENEPNNLPKSQTWTPYLIRCQSYRALLGGAAGLANGSKTIWNFGDGWQNALDLTATWQAKHAYDLFARRAWHTLVPDPAFVTEGCDVDGDPWREATAARTSDGLFALVHLPDARPVTLDLSRLARPLGCARWYDPSSGTYRDANAENIATFTPPAKNDVGDSDWALVLER